MSEMWFQVDRGALDDWRIKWLASELGVSYGDAYYFCSRVWCRLYERGGGVMPVVEVDKVAGHDGFAETLIKVGLGDLTNEGLRIHGEERAQKFVAFRVCQKTKSDAAHRARYGKPENKNLPPGMPPGCPDYSYSLSSGSGSDSGSGESSQRAITRARQAELRELARQTTEVWIEWFNRRFARSFRTTQELSKQVGALLARGFTEKPDMRGVALYLRSRWEDDEKMAPHLVPSTILRPTKFPERLDLAKEWAQELGTDLYEKLWGAP